MRMWMVNPKTLCKNHLLGECKERYNKYKFSSINNKKNIGDSK